MLNIARIVYLVFATFLIIGGIAGYASKGSLPSLMGGVFCGLLAAAAAVLLARNPMTGLGLGLVAALVAGGSLLRRFLDNPVVFPSGLTVLLSVVTLVVTILALLQGQSSSAATK